jgi:hypothetical protein
MHDIELKALQTYQKNLEYLEQYQPEILKKVSLLEIAIENAQYTPSYDLIYQPEGYFDVVNLKTGEYLYGTNSIELSKKITEEVNYKKDEAVIETFYRTRFSDERAKELDEAPMERSLGSAAAPIINYVENIGTYEGDMKDIFKYVFLGVGLGLHMEMIAKKVNAAVYFIAEDNLEIFKLSLFVTDYSAIAANGLNIFLSVMESDDDFRTLFYGFLEKGFIDNSHLKYTMFHDSYIDKVKIMQNYVVTHASNTFPYSAYLMQALDVPYYMTHGYKMVDTSKDYQGSIFSQKPVLLLGAGPSLKYNAEWLQQNSDKFIVVTMLAALKTLHAMGVKPDVITHLDAKREESLNFLEGVDPAFYSKSIILFSADVHPDVTHVFAPEQTFIVELFINYKESFSRDIPAVSIGEATYALSLILGASELYLLGLDLALDQQTGATHASEHFRSEKLDMETEVIGTLMETIFEVKGNFRERVKTTAVLQNSLEKLNSATPLFRKYDQRIYNLSDGAYFNETVPTKVETLELSSMPSKDDDLYEELRSFLHTISNSEFRDVDRQVLEKKVENARRVRQVLEEFDRHVFLSEMEYFAGLNELINDLMGKRRFKIHDDIQHIYGLYFHIIMGYISNMFNTKGLKNHKRHIKKVNTMLKRQMYKIVDTYIAGMEAYL